jgi:hypothetical protein
VLGDPPTGSAQRGQALRVRALRRQQNSGDRHPAAAQVRAGPQRVPAVVSGPDQQRDVPAGHPAGSLCQHHRRPGGQTERGAAHQDIHRYVPTQGVLGGTHSGGGPGTV